MLEASLTFAIIVLAAVVIFFHVVLAVVLRDQMRRANLDRVRLNEMYSWYQFEQSARTFRALGDRRVQ